jgi:hypothetical protein
MPEVYEIAVFENQDLYYSMTMTENIIENYVQMCAKYLPPAWICEAETMFNYGRRFVSYNDRSGGDKPKMVMLIGPVFTANLIEDIRAALKKLYPSQ